MNKYKVRPWGLVFFLTIICLPVTFLWAEEMTTPEEPPIEATEPLEATEPTEPTEPPALIEGQIFEPMAAEKPAEQPRQPRRHLVQPGDTLWSISNAYLIDPFYWPKVWDANRSIKNPDLIYPGNVIFLPGPEDLKAAIPEVEAPAPEEEMVEEEPVTEAPKETKPSAPAITVEESAQRPLDLALLASVGYVLRSGIGSSGVLVGDKDHRVLIGEGDVVYLKPGRFTPKEGDTLIVYRVIRKVYHPKTDRYMGRLVAVLGTMKVTEKGRKLTTAKILKSYNYILAGDLVAPYGSIPLPSLEEVPSAERSQVNGYVVDVKEDKVAIAQFDVVYIDRGIKDGIGRGSNFKVIRDGERTSPFSAGRGALLPSRIIGELEVITVNDRTATAKVRRSSEPINRGDRIQALPVQ